MLDAIFRPRSIAVIGASRKPNTIGYQILENLVTHGFAGAVYPVNPTADAVHSIRAYPSVEAIPDEVDLAVIVVPKQHVCQAAEACGRKGVKGLVVISAGFAEVGGSGVERQKALMEIVRRYGMRLVGPNCMGVLNTAPDRSMNATFAPTMPPAGPVSFMSQSGAMGVTILDYAAEYGIGISQFVSVGNKPDVSGNDLVQYWADDERTGVILMYLENFGNPRKFTQLAREITRKKPIIAVKSGRSVAGARAASSHTGALAGTDAATDALLRQCGVLRADTVEEMFDLAMAFSHQPVPRGNRVAIVTNAGGPGIIIADACEANGLVVTELAQETRDFLAKHFPEEASLANPVDMIASATPQSYRIAVEAVLADPNVDAVVATFVPPLGVRQEDVAEAIVSVAAGQTEKPVVAVLMGREGLPQGLAELNAAGIPGYRFPESGVRALAAMYRHRRWLERPVGQVRAFDADRDTVSGIIAAAKAEGREKLSETEVMRVLEAYGIPVAPYAVARTADEAARAAAEIGYPVVAKVLSPRIIHKSDVGGVAVGLEDEAELRAAFGRMTTEVPARAGIDADAVDGVLVQKMVGRGKETIIGMTLDPQFGPVLMFGLGGIYVEALKDVVFRVQPVTDVDAREMVRAIRGAALLQGVRGEPASDLGALEEAIQRISQLVGDHDAIREMDVNPWMAFAEGGVAVDGRIRIGID
ncbi:acetate--CoA ligase alpha subunit [Longimicrobium sp.]|uniref:acetate--CoA ligase alpha subunit n=1 Tax=Longimicrobium sp. TaxID=2029185 RepID=UPI002E3734A1|nr:acetate--CoA ligase family protein [Longimicrobium sp.]HEX6041321.1 acetate--CoA ligase family protein [Longimicrobium sp.]